MKRASPRNEFDVPYAKDLQENHPDIWALYDHTGELRSAFQFVKDIHGQTLGDFSRHVLPGFLAEQEKFKKNAFDWNTPAGVIAQMHYGIVGCLGMEGMKAVIEPLKDSSKLSEVKRNHVRNWTEVKRSHQESIQQRDAAGNAAGDAKAIPDHYYRALDRAESSVNTESRTATFSFSSELPVERWDWWFGRYKEILGHSAGEYNFDRLNDGGAFLWQHDRYDQRGVVEKAWIENSRAYCTIRFSQNPCGQELMTDMADGIKTCVSFAYDPKLSILVQKDEESGIDTYRVIDWEAFEVSSVSVPADPTVGIGRSQSQSSSRLTVVEKVKEEIVPETLDREALVKEERDRISEITQIGDWKNAQALAAKAVNDGWTVDQFKKHVWEEERAMSRVGNLHVAPMTRTWGESYGLSRKEERSFSITRAIAASVAGDWSQAGLERELSEHLKRSSHKDRGGIHVPIAALSSRAVQKVGNGGNLIEETVLGDRYIDLLRSRCLVQSLGSTILGDLEGDISIPRQTGTTQTYWVPESGALTTSDPGFDSVKLSPKTVGALTRYSRLMVLQSSPDVEQLVRNDLEQTIAVAIDQAAIAGTGTNDEPRGILSTPGIGLVPIGTNGGAITYAHILALESALATTNADIGSLGFLSNPKVRAKLKQTLQNPAATDAGWIWENFSSSPQTMMAEGASTWGQVAGYLAGATNNVPSNLTKGSGTNLSAMILGNWADLLIGTWGTVELLPNPYDQDAYARGDILMRVFASVDVGVRHPESFAVCRDIVTT